MSRETREARRSARRHSRRSASLPFGSRTHISCRLGFSPQPGNTASLLLSRDIVHIPQRIFNIFPRPHPPLQRVFPSGIAHAQVNHLSRAEFIQPPVEVTGGNNPVDRKNDVAE